MYNIPHLAICSEGALEGGEDTTAVLLLLCHYREGPMAIHKPCGQNFGHFWPPPSSDSIFFVFSKFQCKFMSCGYIFNTKINNEDTKFTQVRNCTCAIIVHHIVHAVKSILFKSDLENSYNYKISSNGPHNGVPLAR